MKWANDSVATELELSQDSSGRSDSAGRDRTSDESFDEESLLLLGLSSQAVDMHWATVWESVAGAIPDHPAVSNGDVTLNWSTYERRSAHVAQGLVDAGLAPGAAIGLYLYNGNEYLEAQFAAFKMRGVPINVNYRYLDEELWYLLDNAEAQALFFHSSLGERVARIGNRLPKLTLLVEIVDDPAAAGQVAGAIEYETLLAGTPPMPAIKRPGNDLYMFYTGGTTGMPKGVMYDIAEITTFYFRHGFPRVGVAFPETVDAVAPAVLELAALGKLSTSVTGAPLMHGTGLWLGALMHQLAGGHAVTLTSRSLDPHELLAAIQRHRCTHTTIVGDAFAKPIVRAIDEAIADGHPYDTSSLTTIISSGVMWTAEVKQALLDRIPQVSLTDAMGSTEGGIGTQRTTRESGNETAVFVPNPATKVFDEFDQEIEPGSGKIGMLAGATLVPTGYYKDPEKSARTFRVVNGVRYTFPGDMAMVAADGSLILLGRGSNVINSAGEKIFPEEVEEAVKRVDGIVDCLVVGVDDERFGQAVTAVASVADGVVVDEADVIASVKSQLAGYKAPKRVVFVSQIPRAPNGKADYKAAKDLAG